MILFFNNGWYLPMSGGDLHVLEMARSWARSRDVGIAMPRWAYRLNTKRLTGVRHVATGGPFDGSPPGSLASLFARYAVRSVSGLGADAEVVVAASHYPYDLIPAFLVARRRRRPLVVYVFHLASMFRGAGRRGRLVGLWEALALRLMRRASLVFVDNQEVGEELATRGLARSAIHLTWNGVTPPQTAP
ncbi:MAG TPA: glycosyltransferase family 4 protein, partial [Candidatus Dormibacteraeota bacterium]|nr:glycosyltransferase family 4 protein [Candidatus Dormibacteraeota bacterium]